MIKISNISKPYYNEAKEFIIKSIKKNIIADEKTVLEIIEDLDNIEKSYLKANGKFWIAVEDETNEIVGTIALNEISNKIGVLKRFYATKESKSAPLLYETLERYVKEHGYTQLYLVSGKELKSAHKFYKENGWKKANVEDESINIYVRPNADLYVKDISENVKTDTIAEILVNAIPYIKKYSKSTIVIKYGGNAMIGSKTIENVMNDIVLLQSLGIKVVLVHGGGPEITEFSSKINIKTKFIDGMRVTSKEMLEVCEMVLCGKTNKKLIKALQKCGGKTIRDFWN